MPDIEPVDLKVTPLAFTALKWIDITNYLPHTNPEYYSDAYTEADYLAEFAGRSCYQSWDRPNEKTRENKDYIAHIIEVGHLSVLEHASVTFYLEGISRTCSHQIVRHRHFNYSQLSQRYVDQNKVGFVIPPIMRGNTYSTILLQNSVEQALKHYELLMDDLKQENDDAKRKQLREAARAVLPGCMETKLVMTGNHRAWREYLTKRATSTADAEHVELATELLRQLKTIAPNTYQDM